MRAVSIAILALLFALEIAGLVYLITVPGHAEIPGAVVSGRMPGTQPSLAPEGRRGGDAPVLSRP